MKKRIGNPVAECTSCKLCERSCPTDVKLDRVVRLWRYVSGSRGSHGSMFLTMGKLIQDGGWEYIEGETDPDSDIVFFPGCTPMYDAAFKMVEEQPYGDYSAMGRDRKYGNIGLAALKLLNLTGISPKVVTLCCGHDQYYAGELDEVEELGKRLKEAVSGAATVVTPCAECRHMLRDVHGVPAVHISEFLIGRLEELPLKHTGMKVMYHDPCRLGRYSGVYEPPRELISMVADLVEFERNKEDAVCCGVSAWMNCNSLSKRQREAKIEEFERSGADFLVVSCPKCAMHLDCLYYEEGENRKTRASPNIIDLSELLAIAAGVYDPEEIGASHVRPTGKITRPSTGYSYKHSKNLEKHLDESLVENIFSCSTCFQCTAVCETGHETPALIERMRAVLASRGLNPDKHKEMLRRVLETGNPYGERQEIYEEEKDADLIYFPGCTALYRMKGIYEDTKTILKALGKNYTVPRGMVCCTSPLLRTGQEASEIMAINSRILDRKVVVSCAGCHATLACDYDGIDVEHIVELLAREIGNLPLRERRMKVAYHDPCHLGREFGMYDESRQIIMSLPGVELVEFESNRENSQCCGGGGGLRSWNPQKAAELARQRMDEAERLGVDAVVSACPFCKLNLQSVTSMPVLDIVELVRDFIDEKQQLQENGC